MTMKTDTASLINGVLTATRYYEWPEPHSQDFRLVEVPLDSERCLYWTAANGVIRGFAVESGETCMANVQSMLQQAVGASHDASYVIWKPRNVTASVIKRWVTKWSKRTVLSMAA